MKERPTISVSNASPYVISLGLNYDARMDVKFICPEASIWNGQTVQQIKPTTKGGAKALATAIERELQKLIRRTTEQALQNAALQAYKAPQKIVLEIRVIGPDDD